MHFDQFASHLGCAFDFAIFAVPNRLRRFLTSERRFHMAQRAIRFSEKTDKEIQEAARKRGFSSPTAFIRHSVQQELSGRSEELVGAEERLVASIERIRQEVFRLGRAQQALFAFLDSLAKVVLTCVPKPSGDAMEAAVARARGRHARLMKSAGQAMIGDSQLAMQDLVKHGEE
jgi:AraC-like DNA-binding protein